MNDTRTPKEQRMYDNVKDAVSKLLNISEEATNKVASTECRRIAIEIGNLLAPQLYGNRGHGISNAVSICVRLCSEALFWLDMMNGETDDVVTSVETLLQSLSSPTL